MRVLLGLDACPDLEWTLHEIPLHTLSAADRHIGVVFQSYELFPHLTGFENVEFAARARKMKSSDFQDRWKHFAEALNLESFAHRPADKLSGGEKQRVALARAMIARPRWLFLDEPFANLDLELRDSARQLVKNLIKAEGTPALLVTHDPQDLSSLAQLTHEIRNGTLLKK